MYRHGTYGRTCERNGRCFDSAPITVPVGESTLGRMFNVLGEPIDNKPMPKAQGFEPIHRPAPSFEEQATSTEMLETGIKVVDLLCPYQRGGKIGLFGAPVLVRRC